MDIPELIVCGVLDSLSPLYVAVWAWFVAACISLHNQRKSLLWFAGFFLFIFYAFNLLLLLGVFNYLLLSKWYRILNTGVVVLLGGWLCWIGGELLRRWFREISAPEAAELPVDVQILPLAHILRATTAVFLAIVMAFALSVWPPSEYVTLLAANFVYPGKGWETVLVLAFYSFIKIVFLIFTLLGALVLAQYTGQKQKTRLRRSMLYIIMAAFYIGMGGAIIILSLT